MHPYVREELARQRERELRRPAGRHVPLGTSTGGTAQPGTAPGGCSSRSASHLPSGPRDHSWTASGKATFHANKHPDSQPAKEA